MRLVMPFRNGKAQAPRISTRPGCTHSRVIVVFRTHEPELPQELRHFDNHHARDQPVDGFPGREVLKPELSGLRMKETRNRELAEGRCCQASVKPALHPSEPDGVLQMLLEELHGTTFPARVKTGFGKIPRTKLARAVTNKGMTIQGISRTSLCPDS